MSGSTRDDSQIPTPQKHEIPFPPVIESPASCSVISLHPEFRFQNKAHPASRQTYCGPSVIGLIFDVKWRN